MDTPTISGAVALQSALLQQQVDIAMLAKANAVAKSQGEAVVELIQSAAEISSPPNAAGNSGVDVVA